MKIVAVSWLDATMESAQLDLETARSLKPTLRHSVGYLLANDNENVRICMGIIDYHNIMYENTLVIPFGDVQEIRDLV